MPVLARRDPLGRDWPELFGRRLDDLWPLTLFEPAERGGVRVEEFREDGALVVRAELPGIDPEKDVEISIHDGLLHIKGERSEHLEETKKTHFHTEFRYGMFERTLPLPAGTTEKDIQAIYKDGVLEVRLPMKKAGSEAAKVKVQRMA